MSGSPVFPSSNEVHASSTNFYLWLASVSLNIPTGYKAGIFFKDDCRVTTPYVELPYEIDQGNPFFIGYVYPNERNELMTHCYQMYWSLYEMDDHKNQIRSKHVFADDLFTKFRRFKDSSVVDQTEVMTTIAQIFSGWEYTKEMWNKIDQVRPKTGFVVFRGGS